MDAAMPLHAWLHPKVQAALAGGSVASFGRPMNDARNRRRAAGRFEGHVAPCTGAVRTGGDGLSPAALPEGESDAVSGRAAARFSP